MFNHTELSKNHKNCGGSQSTQFLGYAHTARSLRWEKEIKITWLCIQLHNDARGRVNKRYLKFCHLQRKYTQEERTKPNCGVPQGTLFILRRRPHYELARWDKGNSDKGHVHKEIGKITWLHFPHTITWYGVTNYTCSDIL